MTTTKILDATILETDLAAGAITSAKIATSAVTTTQIADGTIVTADIAAQGVANANLAANAVTSVKIADGTIVAADIATSAVTTTQILDATVAEVDLDIITASGAGTDGYVLTWDNVAGKMDWVAPVSLTKTLTIEAPIAGDDITMFRTGAAITIVEVAAISIGTSPSTTYVLRHSTDRSSTGTLVTTSAATTSVTTGDVATLSDTTVPANSWVWFEASAATGTDVTLSVYIRYTEN